MRAKGKRVLDRLLRRIATAVGGGAIFSGDDVATAAGVLLILAEIGIQEWRERREKKKAAK